jgi:uncharacterized membrane protein YGL010W
LKTIQENLTQYAAYHRDRRNIATHLAGIPMIVFAAILSLQAAWVPLGPVAVTLAAIVSLVACLYYFHLDWAFGIAMAVVLFAMCAVASEIAARFSLGALLALAAAIFVAGWGLQFLGHRCEGMKPAFYDDMMQLAIGPLFVCAEVFFLLGAKAELRRHIEERVGPTVARRTARPDDEQAVTR